VPGHLTSRRPAPPVRPLHVTPPPPKSRTSNRTAPESQMPENPVSNRPVPAAAPPHAAIPSDPPPHAAIPGDPTPHATISGAPPPHAAIPAPAPAGERRPFIGLPSEPELRARVAPGPASPYDFGFLGDMSRLLAAHPRIGPAMQRAFAEIMFAPGALDRAEREMVAAVASAAQDCEY